MKQKDHKLLARFLLNDARNGKVFQNSFMRKMFTAGCVAPDYLPTTYLSGIFESGGMFGHDEKYSADRLQKSICKLQRKGMRTPLDAYRLGTVMHYIADSFTFPHTRFFTGDMTEHRRYEGELHAVFEPYIREKTFESTNPDIDSVRPVLAQMRKEYEQSKPTLFRDCKYIVKGCQAAFEIILKNY